MRENYRRDATEAFAHLHVLLMPQQLSHITFSARRKVILTFLPQSGLAPAYSFRALTFPADAEAWNCRIFR
eukprot:4282464-Heterocapsa_arctica.AAC.1